MNLLCLIGIHDWHWECDVEPIEVRTLPYTYEYWEECSCCGKQKNHSSKIEWNHLNKY